MRGRIAVIRLLKHPEGELNLKKLPVFDLPNWHSSFHGSIQSGVTHCFDIRHDHSEQLAWLFKTDPEYLCSYPSNTLMLAGLLAESGRKLPRLKAIQVIAENVDETMKTRIEKAFGVPVYPLYSCVEAGYLATRCPQGHGFHLHAENVLMEILNDQNEPCKPGEVGRTVMTVLHNFATPLIRYELRDDIVMGEEVCPCGRGLPLYKQIIGKQRPQLQLPDGRWRDPSTLVTEIAHIPNYHQHQIIQHTKDHVTVRIVRSKDWTDDQEKELRKVVADFFEKPVQLNLEYVTRVEISPRGKLRDVLCEIGT